MKSNEFISILISTSKILRGSLLSMGQVYAVESVVCSIIMYIGIIMFSPMLSIALFSGSLLASVCGKLQSY